MNPYTQQVIDTTMADLDRQRQMQQNQLGAQASAARAFGGSRQGIAEAETNRAFAQQGGQLAAQLRQQGFQTALGASQQDVANQMQAALANQAAGGRATEFGQQLGFQGQTANQQAAMQAALANQAAAGRAAEFGQSTGLQAALANQQAGLQGANLRLSGAGQLGGLAQQGFNMGQQIGQQQFQQGEMQRMLNQSLIDAGRGQYGGFTGAPAASLNLPLAALGWAARLPTAAAAAWLAAWPLLHLGLLLRPALAHYGGLSGVLHAGVAVATLWLVVQARGARRAVGAMVATGLVAKVALERPFGEPWTAAAVVRRIQIRRR
jgi:hypothetical protein